MKKLLSVLFCLVLLGNSLTLPAHAATSSLSLSCPERCAAGETFTVDIIADSIANCCGISFHITYDPDQVEVTDVVKSSTLSAWYQIDNYVYAPGELAVTLSGTMALDLSGTIASVSFTAKSSAQGISSFALTELEAVTPTSDDIPLTGGSDTVDITPMDQALLTVIPQPGENNTLVLNVELSQASYYCGLSFILNYDETHYTIANPATDVVKATDFAGFGAVNPNYGPGQIFISTAFVTPSCLNGHLATITLTPIDGATGIAEDVTITIRNFVDSSYENLDIDWVYHPVVVTELDPAEASLSAIATLVNSHPSAQEFTVLMALFASDGKLLSVTAQSMTISAGACGIASLTLPNNDSAAYANFFFLDGDFCPFSATIRQTLASS